MLVQEGHVVHMVQVTTQEGQAQAPQEVQMPAPQEVHTPQEVQAAHTPQLQKQLHCVDAIPRSSGSENSSPSVKMGSSMPERVS
jgi:hypothetical protein